jgi:hypothetical protein
MACAPALVDWIFGSRLIEVKPEIGVEAMAFFVTAPVRALQVFEKRE